MPLTLPAVQPPLTRRLDAQDLHAPLSGLLHAAQRGAHDVPHRQHQAADEQHLSEALPWTEAGAQVKRVPCCCVGSAPHVLSVALAQFFIPAAAQQQSQKKLFLRTATCGQHCGESTKVSDVKSPL